MKIITLHIPPPPRFSSLSTRFSGTLLPVAHFWISTFFSIYFYTLNKLFLKNIFQFLILSNLVWSSEVCVQHVCIQASSQMVPPFPEIGMLCYASLYNIIILQDGDNLIWIQLRMLCGEDKCLYGWMSRGRGSNLPVFISRTISPPIKIMKVWRLLSYAAPHNEVLLVQ